LLTLISSSLLDGFCFRSDAFPLMTWTLRAPIAAVMSRRASFPADVPFQSLSFQIAAMLTFTQPILARLPDGG